MTKQQLILNYLKNVGPLTPDGATNLCNARRLGGVVFRLKSKGHKIRTELITEGTSTFAKYWYVH